MKALLFSNFPERYVRDSILPKLKARGIEISKILPPKAAANSPDADGAWALLFMHEMASHADDGHVRAFGERSGLPVICLSRKSSMWDDRLPKPPEEVRKPKPEFWKMVDAIESEVPSIPSVLAVPADGQADTETQTQTEVQAMPSNTTRFVPTELVEPMLRRFIELRDSGWKFDDIVPHVRQFWTGGKLETGGQLQSYLSNVFRRKDCPEFYKKWYGEKHTTHTKTETDMNAQAAADKPQSLKSLDEKELEKVLKRIMDLRGKGKPYGEILQAIRGAWSDNNAPRDANELAKFSHTVSRSPRCPAWFKVWYEKTKTRTGVKAKKTKPPKKAAKPKAKDDAELAKIYADECETLKKRIKELESGGPKTSKAVLAEMKETLRKLFDGCSQLIDIGAISPKDAFGMALKYIGEMS